MPVEPLRFHGIPASAVPLALGKQLTVGFTRIGQRVHERALILVPRNTGRLAASHYVLVGTDGSGRVTVQVGANAVQPRYSYNGSYAASVHNGARPHEIVPRFAAALRFVKNGQVIVTSKVNHPGNHPNPWLWNATTSVIRMVSVSSERLVSAGTSLGESVV